MNCFFVSDLHGQISRYESLFTRIREEKPAAVFLGGDLFPHFAAQGEGDFLDDFLAKGFLQLKESLGRKYPRVFLIPGNDDSKISQEDLIRWMVDEGIWEYVHGQSVEFGSYTVFGYAYVPPTPFFNKDWERYDISRFVDPGCIPPEDGWHSVDEPKNLIEHATIKKDLEELSGRKDLSKSIFLFHTPPYQTALDRAALEGKMVDHVPLDVHVGSIAVKDFILKRQPLITLHGHVHESARITGAWMEQMGETIALSAAHDGDELALVKFDPAEPDHATRELI
ncbi:MAG: metallophosphoesterase [Anaerolineales bacterium]|nr:metallophosphoesterase [Anaerolineales bacterium]